MNIAFRLPRPAVDALVSIGHPIIIETQAGVGSGISNEDYTSAGATLAPDAKMVYQKGEMILKVKELFPGEFDFLKEGQIIFTYIHSASNPEETQALLDKKVIAVNGIRHYCVDNLPSAVAKTASYALSNTRLPYVIKIADKGWLQAIKEDIALSRGLGFAWGYLTFKPTALAHNRQYTPVADVIEMLE